MPPRYMATVSCPSCGSRFQTPVEQILDVRADPAARNRIIGGSVNVAVCPSCGTGGALNIPFIYHDPDKEVALLFLPIESGPTEVERQAAAGRLARQLMDAMAPEERKGYLLTPETFIAMDTLVRRVLELEGITEDDMAEAQRQREFVVELLQAEQSAWPEMVTESMALIDEGAFAFLEYLMQMVASGQQIAEPEKLDALHEYLVNETEVGRTLAQRSEIFRAFAEAPTQASLLEALTRAPDDETVTLLVQSGISLMDYAFFQALVKCIDSAESPEEKAELQKLRRTILDLRDEMMKQSESEVRERTELLLKLIRSADPERLASSHLSELDETFFAVLGGQMREAQKQGATEAVQDIQRVATAVNRVLEGNMPPEVALARRLMAVPEDQLDQQLQAMRQLLTPRFLEFLEAMGQSLVDQGQTEAAERMARVAIHARRLVPEAAESASQRSQPEEAAPAQRSGSDSETRTPSGLIIAKR
jgi:hypothetical protein